MIKSVINIEAPRPHVFHILTNFAEYDHWMPGCTKSEVRSLADSHAEVDITVKSVKTMTMGLRFDLTENQLLNFKMIRGDDLKAYEGSWRLMDAADGRGTVVMGEMEMDAGAMVPKFMVSRMAKKAIEDTGTALKKRVAQVPVEMSAEEQVEAQAAPVKDRRILHVLRVPNGFRIWFLGQSSFVSSEGFGRQRR